MVTTPQKISAIDVTRAINLYKKFAVPIIGIIENMSYYTSQNFSENLKCSITLDVIRDPVISKYGYSFEKSQIFLSLKNKNSCPLSNRELSLKDIRPNITLRNAIKYEILMEKYKRLFN